MMLEYQKKIREQRRVPVTAKEMRDHRMEAVLKDNPLRTQVGGKHYKDLKIQPIEYCQRNQLNYCESNVVKYVTRHRFKNGREDIEKAIHNLELLLEIEYGEDIVS